MGLMAERGAQRRGGGRPTGPWRACSGVARSSRAGLGRRKTLVAARNRPQLRPLLPPRLQHPNPSTWASWRGSPSSEIRASSPTRISKPRRSSSSVSERRVRRRGEHLGRGHALRPTFIPLFTQPRRRSILGSCLPYRTRRGCSAAASLRILNA
jgi:hypothetical protein